MGSVRIRPDAPRRVFDQDRHRDRCPVNRTAALRTEALMLDLVFVLGGLAVFVIIGLIGRAVERL